MFTNELMFKSECPLVEEFHIKNIVGALERKQWVFGGRVTTPGGAAFIDTTLLTLSSGIIPRLDHYRVLVQKLNAANIEEPWISSKTSTGFRVNGDVSSLYSVVVLGTEPIPPKSQKKWAKDYCPFCKSQGFDGIVGSTLLDLVLFAFRHTQSGGVDAVKFATEMTMKNLTGQYKGQMGGPLVTVMMDNTYQVNITKSTSGIIVTPPYASSLAVDGFTLNGEAGETYDVLVLGQIRF